MTENCTALWRGYVATWVLKNKELYLVRVQTNYCDDNPTEIDISNEFGKSRVAANWVNEIIRSPRGRILQYVHMGYMSIYEEEVYYHLKNGKLTATKKVINLERDKSLVFPGEGYLKDTIQKLILKRIVSAERSGFNEDSSCFVTISFDKNRAVSHIGIGYGGNKKPETSMEKILYAATREALKGFPRLMKVNHKRYSPPTLQIFFSGYCLKYPRDREYGCTYE